MSAIPLLILATIATKASAADTCADAHRQALASGYYGGRNTPFSVMFGDFDHEIYEGNIAQLDRGKVCRDLIKKARSVAEIETDPARLSCMETMLGRWGTECGTAAGVSYDPTSDLSALAARRRAVEGALTTPDSIAPGRLAMLRDLVKKDGASGAAAIARSRDIFGPESLGALDAPVASTDDPLLSGLEAARPNAPRVPTTADYAAWQANDVRKILLRDGAGVLHDVTTTAKMSAFDFDRAQVEIAWGYFDEYGLLPPLSRDAEFFERSMNRRLLDVDARERANAASAASEDPSEALAARLEGLDPIVRPWSVLFLAAGVEASVAGSPGVQGIITPVLRQFAKLGLDPADAVARMRSFQGHLAAEDIEAARADVRGMVTMTAEDLRWLKAKIDVVELAAKQRREAEQQRRAAVAAEARSEQQADTHAASCRSLRAAFAATPSDACASLGLRLDAATLCADVATELPGIAAAYESDRPSTLSRCSLGAESAWDRFMVSNRDAGSVFPVRQLDGQVLAVQFRMDRSWSGILPQDDTIRRILSLACGREVDVGDVLGAEASDGYLNGAPATVGGATCRVVLSKLGGTMIGEVSRP